MSSLFLESISQQLIYNLEKSPVENIEQFFNATQAIQYEWVEKKVNDQIVYCLEGPWKDEIHLLKISSEFQEQLTRHLVQMSLSEEIDYPKLLSECKHRIQDASYHFNMPFVGVVITLRPSVPNTSMPIIPYEDLPDKEKQTIRRCYSVNTVFFQQLMFIVEEEMKEFQFRKYIISTGRYEWIGEKTKLSEIALALSLSGWIVDKKGKAVKPGVLTRLLGAFFNIKAPDYAQNLAAMTNRTVMSPTEGLEYLLKISKEYLAQRAENQY